MNEIARKMLASGIEWFILPVMPAAEFKLYGCATNGVQAVAACSEHEFDRHSHDQFGIGLITAGAQRWHSDRRQVEAHAGNVIAVNAGEVHDGSALDRKARSWSILYFDPQVLAGPADEIVGSEMTIRKPVFDDWRVRRIMVRLYMAEVKRAEAIRRQELLFNLIALVGSRASRGSDLAPPVGRAKAAIDDAPWRGWSLRELAEESGISRFQLIRGFACATGLTPHAYIVQRRIELVRELIRRGVPLADAALQSGFADQSHMTRIFVRKYGFSPGAYARPCFHAGRLCSERSGSRPSPRTT